MAKVEIGKTYNVYAPYNGRLLDSIKIQYIEGSVFQGYSVMFDYETSYDLSDGIKVEKVGN